MSANDDVECVVEGKGRKETLCSFQGLLFLIIMENKINLSFLNGDFLKARLSRHRKKREREEREREREIGDVEDNNCLC